MVRVFDVGGAATDKGREAGAGDEDIILLSVKVSWFKSIDRDVVLSTFDIENEELL